MTSVPPTAPAKADDHAIRVMVVDDSAVIRGFLTRYIDAAGDLKVTASAPNGQMALSTLDRQQIDVVVLDIEMPVMDGIAALPLILQRDPHIAVIMASTLTKENAAISLRCLQMGATECLAKPTSSEMSGSTAFQDALVEKVREIGRAVHKRRGHAGVAVSTVARAPATVAAQATATPAADKKINLRPLPLGWRAPDVIAIGSSTGGPQALTQFFSELKGPLKQPIFVTQHMPPMFTAILADNIARHSGMTCREAVHGEKVEASTVYVAPGNYHMTVHKDASGASIALNQEPPENFCRPSVDPMLRSLINVYGGRILTVIFTGMGADGLKGSQKVAEAGGVIYAQDEATSVVWGMPGAVATAGLCTQVLPLGLMARAVRDCADPLAGRRP